MVKEFVNWFVLKYWDIRMVYFFFKIKFVSEKYFKYLKGFIKN